MFLQLGGLPDPTSSPASQLFYWLWMLFVVEQWVASGMAAVSNVLAFASFELQNQVRVRSSSDGLRTCAEPLASHSPRPAHHVTTSC